MPIINTGGAFVLRGISDPPGPDDTANRRYVDERITEVTRTSFFEWTGDAPIIPLDVYRFNEENFLYLGPEVIAYNTDAAYTAGDHALFNGDVYEALGNVPSAAAAPLDVDFFGTWMLVNSNIGPGQIQSPGGGDIVLSTGAAATISFDNTDADGVDQSADLTTLTTGDVLYVYDTSGDLVVVLTFASYLASDTNAPRYVSDRDVTLTTGTTYSLRWGGDGVWNDVGPIEPDATSPNWEVVGLDQSDTINMNTMRIAANETAIGTNLTNIGMNTTDIDTLTDRVDNLAVPLINEDNAHTFGPTGISLSNDVAFVIDDLAGRYNEGLLQFEVEASTLQGFANGTPPGTLILEILDTDNQPLLEAPIAINSNNLIDPQIITFDLSATIAAQDLRVSIRFPTGTSFGPYGWSDFQIISGQVSQIDDLVRGVLREDLGIDANSASITEFDGLFDAFSLANGATGLGFLDIRGSQTVFGGRLITFRENEDTLIGTFVASGSTASIVHSLAVPLGLVTPNDDNGAGMPSGWLVRVREGTGTGGAEQDSDIGDRITPIDGFIVRQEVTGLTDGATYAITIQHNDTIGDIHARVVSEVDGTFEVELHPEFTDYLDTQYVTYPNAGITVHHAVSGTPVNADYDGTSGNTRAGTIAITADGDYTIATTIEITSLIGNFAQGQWRLTLADAGGTTVASRNITVNSDNQAQTTKNLVADGLTAQTYTLTATLTSNNNVSDWTIFASASTNDHDSIDVDPLVYTDLDTRYALSTALTDEANTRGVGDEALSARIDNIEASGTIGPQGDDGLSYLVLYNDNADDNPPNQPESRVTGSDLWESTNQGRVETNTFAFTGDQTGGRWHAAGYTPVAETNELTFTGSTLGTVTTPGTDDQPNMVEINFTGRGGSTSVTTPISAQPEITDLTFSGTSSFYPSGNPFRPGLFDATLLDITGSEGMWVSTGGLTDNGSRHTLALSSLARPTGDPAGQTRFLFDKTTQGSAAYYANNGPHGFLGSNVIHNIISHINTNTVDNDGVLFTTEEKAQAALFTDTTDGFTPFRSDAGGVSTDWVMQAHCWPVNNYIRIGLTGLHSFEDAPDVRFIDAAATLYVALMIVKYNLRSTATTTFNGVTINGIFDWADAVSEYNTLEAPSWDADTDTLRFTSTDDTRENAGWAIANGQLVSSDTAGTTQSGSVTTRNITLTSLQEPSGAASNTNAVTANHVVTFNEGYLWLATDVSNDPQDSVFFEFVNTLGYKSITPEFTVFDTNTSATTYSPAEAAAVIRGKLAAWLAEQTQIDFFRGDTPTLAFGPGETYFQVLIDDPTDSTLMAVGVSRSRSAAEFEGHVVEEALSLSVELNGLVNGAILNDANRGSIQIANLLFDESAVTYSEYLVPLLSDASANAIAQYVGDRIAGDSNISDTFDAVVNDATIRLTTRVDEPQGDMVLRLTGSSASSLTGSAVVIQQGSVGVATTDDGVTSSFTFSIDRDFHNQLLADDALPGAITFFETDSNNITTYTIQNPEGIRAENVAINFRNFIVAVFDGFDIVEFSNANSVDATVRLVSSQTVVSDATEVSPLVNVIEPGTGGSLAATNAVTAGRAGTMDVTTGVNPTLTLNIDPIHHSVGTLVIDLPPFASAEASAHAVATYFIDNPQYEYVVSTLATTPNVVTLTSETPGAEIDMVGTVFAGSVNNDMTSPGSLALSIDITQGADSGSPIFDETGEGRIEFDALDENHRTDANLVPYNLNLVGSRIGLRYLVDFVDTGDVTTEDLVVSWSYPATNRANTPTEIDVSGHINVASGTSLANFTTALIAELNASVVSNILVDVDLDDYILARTTQPAIGDLHLQALGTRTDLIGDELTAAPITGLTSSYSGVDFRVGTDNTFLTFQAGSFNDSPAVDTSSWTVQTYLVRDADDDTTTFADDAFVLNLGDGLFYRNETGGAAVFTTADYTVVDDWNGSSAYSTGAFVAYRGDVYLNAVATTAPTLGNPTDGPTLTAANDEPRLIVHPSVQTVLDDLAAQANDLTTNNDFGFRATTTTTELILAGVDREAEEDLEFTFNAPSNSNLAVDLSIEQGINPGTIDYWMPNYDTGSNWFIAIPNTDLNLDTVTAADWLSQAVVPVGGGGGGTEVVANPIGLDGTDLTRIQIGGVNYVLPTNEVNPNVPDAPADTSAIAQYVLQTPVENTGATPEWVAFTDTNPGIPDAPSTGTDTTNRYTLQVTDVSDVETASWVAFNDPNPDVPNVPDAPTDTIVQYNLQVTDGGGTQSYAWVVDEGRSEDEINTLIDERVNIQSPGLLDANRNAAARLSTAPQIEVATTTFQGVVVDVPFVLGLDSVTTADTNIFTVDTTNNSFEATSAGHMTIGVDLIIRLQGQAGLQRMTGDIIDSNDNIVTSFAPVDVEDTAGGGVVDLRILQAVTFISVTSEDYRIRFTNVNVSTATPGGFTQAGTVYIAEDAFTIDTYQAPPASPLAGLSDGDVVAVDSNGDAVAATQDQVNTLIGLTGTGTAATRVDARAAVIIAGSSVDVLSDVDTTSVAPTNGQALTWNGTSSMWEPLAISGGTVNTNVILSNGELERDYQTIGNYEYKSVLRVTTAAIDAANFDYTIVISRQLFSAPFTYEETDDITGTNSTIANARTAYDLAIASGTITTYTYTEA